MIKRDKRYKIVFTFGLSTNNAKNVVIVNCNDSVNAREYVYNKYGQNNIAFTYHYNEESLKNGCEWQSGLFEEFKDNYSYGKDMIERFNLKVIEETTLDDFAEDDKKGVINDKRSKNIRKKCTKSY